MWDECQQILHTVFITEEREWILIKATETLPEIASMADDQRTVAINCVLQRKRPQWDYNTEKGRKSLSEYHQVLLGGMK